MINFKQKIAEEIAKEIKLPQEEIYDYIEIPTEEKMGDFSFPCFKLAKELRKAPQMIAEQLKQKITFEQGLMQRIEVVSRILKLLY